MTAEQDKGPLGHAYEAGDDNWCLHCSEPASAHKAEEPAPTVSFNMPLLKKSPHPLVTEAGMERSDCGLCRDGNRPIVGPNGYLWHEFSGEEPEPCLDRNNQPLAPEPADKAGASLEQIAEAAVGPLEGIEIPYGIAIRMSTARIVERIAPLVRAAEAAARKEECRALAEHYDDIAERIQQEFPERAHGYRNAAVLARARGGSK